DVTPGGTSRVIKGNVLTPTTIYQGGQVAIDDQGKISCVGCGCAKGGETIISCSDAVISPGLINTHDHITYTQNLPYTDKGVRYEDRQQWRIGATNRPKIPAPGGASADQISWGELRFLMGGATSIVGSGGEKGLIRNLDQAANEEGLAKTAVKFDTFPLDDTSGTKRTADCNYGGTATTVSSIASVNSYEPHTSEGIDDTAHNEFLCESSANYDTTLPGVSNDLVIAKTSIIHGIGLNPADYAAMATAGTGLIWSPRSNITLYGDTAHVSEAARMGVNIALGTDWMPSGSSSLLRELACADSFNAAYLDHYFSDQQLWQMVTSNAALVTKMDDVIGTLASGKVADITIFASHGKQPFRSVIEAEPKDVTLVMRGGTALYGDDALIQAVGSATCDSVSVCSVDKRVCVKDDLGKSFADLQTAAGAVYPAFSCGVPANEPSCAPKRPESVSSSTIYTGVAGADDTDGDGIANATDNCPTVFNPIRPMDNGVQGDADGDGQGDVCDPCPLDKGTTTCTTGNPDDRDNDGVSNETDNCPDVANADQADTDHDGKGDACDPCPNAANPGSQGCPVSIYDVKNGTATVGSVVRITNAIVTGKGSNGFYVQVKEGDTGYTGADNSGLFVFTSGATLTSAVVGQRVTMDGSVAVFQNEIELATITTVTANGIVEALPAAIPVSFTDVATGGPRAATLEAVLVSLGGSVVTALDATDGEFTMTDDAANADGGAAVTLIGDDFLYVPAPALLLNQALNSATGILALRQMASKLEPRSAADLPLGPPSIAAFSPALAYARVGVTNNAPTFAPSLTVNLSNAAQGDTTVNLTSLDAALTVPASVIVLDGTSSVVVPVTAVSQNADVSVIAALATAPTKQVTGHVRVLGAAEAPTTVTLSPATAAVTPNGTTTLTATLDLPALGDTVVSLAATAGGSVPATVTVLDTQKSATFTYTDVSADAGVTTPVTVTATFGASTSNTIVTVSTGANHLVLNEIDYDNVGTGDSKEFVEIFNPTGAAISLVGVKLYLVNGANNLVYTTVDLTSAASLPSQGYLVIAGAGVTVPGSAIHVSPTPAWTTNAIQNGNPDGAALVDTNTTTLIDAVSYGGAMTAVTLPGFAAKVSLTEGTAATAKDSNTIQGSFCRSPNGTDTDHANLDWKFCTTVTVGVANP
ncbi:MAG: amidohydrolase family protein, partial [Polyangiaceae bacterium]